MDSTPGSYKHKNGRILIYKTPQKLSMTPFNRKLHRVSFEGIGAKSREDGTKSYKAPHDRTHGGIELVHADTKLHKGDIFTKEMPPKGFNSKIFLLHVASSRRRGGQS